MSVICGGLTENKCLRERSVIHSNNVACCVDGAWKTKCAEKLQLGSGHVSCLLVVCREVWAACETSIHVISTAAAAASASVDKPVLTKVCSS